MSVHAFVQSRGLTLWRTAEGLFDNAFGSAFNPLRHLGAIGVLAFALLVASGTLLYILFDTSAQAAWHSIERLDALPLASGRLLRGLHRYAADLFVIAMGLHLLREWVHRHERGFRRFSWLTGVPLIALVFFAAIGGFWLNWDQLGQYSAVATAEWVDALPLLAAPLARNFLGSESVSDRLFSLLVFVHIGVPLLLSFGLWFHLQRITRPVVLPPRRLLGGTLAALSVLALARPVTSHAPAALDRMPEGLRLDWIVLFWHPLVDATSGGFVWALVAAAAVLLLGLPFLPHRPEPVAVVDAENCNGCTRCFVDCPYAAVSLVPHPNQRTGRQLAVVDADLCAGCGICAGACPSSTPFRSAAQLVTGIDMPQRPVGDLRRQLQRALAGCAAERPLVLFACAHGVAGVSPAPDVLALPLLCAGQLPPSFVEYALRDGAAGVAIAACAEGGCEFRLGERWTRERLSGEREPHLRPGVEAERVELVFAAAGDPARVAAALARLRRRVDALPPLPPDVATA